MVDTIAHTTKKVITEKMDKDPAFYQKFLKPIQQAIEDFRAKRISDLDDMRGWRELEIPPLTTLTFRHETLKEWQSHPFRSICQERKGTLPEGVKE